MRAERPSRALMPELRSDLSIQLLPEKALIPAGSPGREALRNGHYRLYAIASSSAWLSTMAPRSATWLAEPPSAPASLIADHAGDDFRCGCRRLHAIDRCGRAAGRHGDDRADGCPHPECRSEGDYGVAAGSEGPRELPGTDVSGLPSHCRWRRSSKRQQPT